MREVPGSIYIEVVRDCGSMVRLGVHQNLQLGPVKAPGGPCAGCLSSRNLDDGHKQIKPPLVATGAMWWSLEGRAGIGSLPHSLSLW